MLIAAVNAVAVAYLVFYDKITSVPYTVLSKLRGSPIDVTVIALVIVILAAIALKALTHRGTAFQGGLPSAHAAVAFAAWVAVTFVAANTDVRAADLGDHAVPRRARRPEPRPGRASTGSPRWPSGAALGIAITARPLPHLVPAVSRRPPRSLGASGLLFEEARDASPADAPTRRTPASPSAPWPSARRAAATTASTSRTPSYPAGLCAERAALAALVTHGERELRYVAVAAADGPDCLPCGFCLQALAEFGDPEIVARVARRAARRAAQRAAHGPVRASPGGGAPMS